MRSKVRIGPRIPSTVGAGWDAQALSSAIIPGNISKPREVLMSRYSKLLKRIGDTRFVTEIHRMKCPDCVDGWVVAYRGLNGYMYSRHEPILPEQHS
jgi:hypothetical protein